jgi:hypothetical protein
LWTGAGGRLFFLSLLCPSAESALLLQRRNEGELMAWEYSVESEQGWVVIHGTNTFTSTLTTLKEISENLLFGRW